MDFTFCTIRESKHTVLHLVDTGTGYSEAAITTSRKAETIIDTFETQWLHRHGAPLSVSADDEMNNQPCRKFFGAHSIQYKPRPARRHNKTGIVERKNGTLKLILERLQKESTRASDHVILSRATFISNYFSGSRILSSFELARGYSPSILGVPKSLVTTELLSAHKEQVAVRALQRLLRSRTPSTVAPSSIQIVETVLFYYRSTKQNEPDQWLEGTIQSTRPELVEIRRSNRGPACRVAYEDIRLLPQSPLTKRLMESVVDDYLDLPDGGEIDVHIHPANSSPQTNAMMTSNVVMRSEGEERASRDIGEYATDPSRRMPNELRSTLQSNDQQTLREIYHTIGNRQVTSRDLEFAPAWVIQKAMQKEHRNNWQDAYEEINDKDVPRNSNIISSHALFKIKESEDDSLVMKARFVLHGNRDREKNDIRKDSASADMTIFRLVLSLGVILNFTFGVADIKGAYMQSGPAKREIYVRPPKDWTTTRHTLWKLLKLPYGIVEAGRQWLKTIEEWMLNVFKLERIFGVNQLFVRRGQGDKVILIVAKVIDDFIVAGPINEIQNFMHNLKKIFEVGKICIGENFMFNGCEVEIDKQGNAKLSMEKYTRRLKPLHISRSRRHEIDTRANEREVSEYRSLAGTLMYLGSGVVPQAALVTSRMQQRLGDLRVKHLIDANAMLSELTNVRPTICFLNPGPIRSVTLTTLSDASHGGAEFDYGQSGIISGLKIDTTQTTSPIFHSLSWTRHKQKRVTYSSFGAEILACADAEDRGHDLKESFKSIFPHSKIKHEVLVDSRALFDTITTLHEAKEYRLRKTVTRIRNAFES